jgi:hypothetical protein
MALNAAQLALGLEKARHTSSLPHLTVTPLRHPRRQAQLGLGRIDRGQARSYYITKPVRLGIGEFGEFRACMRFDATLLLIVH